VNERDPAAEIFKRADFAVDDFVAVKAPDFTNFQDRSTAAPQTVQQ
jgi:hypothetical protein